MQPVHDSRCVKKLVLLSYFRCASSVFCGSPTAAGLFLCWPAGVFFQVCFLFDPTCLDRLSRPPFDLGVRSQRVCCMCVCVLLHFGLCAAQLPQATALWCVFSKFSSHAAGWNFTRFLSLSISFCFCVCLSVSSPLSPRFFFVSSTLTHSHTHKRKHTSVSCKWQCFSGLSHWRSTVCTVCIVLACTDLCCVCWQHKGNN